MAQKDFLSDLDCPQFVDFVDGLTEQDDIFFESAKLDSCTPVSAISRVGRRAVSTKFNKPTSRPLFDKNRRTAIARNAEMHPKASYKSPVQSIKEKLEKSPCVNLEPRSPSPYEATTERHLRRRSQSESVIEDIGKPIVGFCMPMPRKRSMSADDVRIRKKITYPTTPLCLKRPKKAKQIKTTEQLELEKIAQLQKELSDHLRLNEMSMKRLGLRKRVNPAPVELPVKTPCVFRAPEPPREAEKFNYHKRTNAINNLRKTDEEARSKVRNLKAAAQFAALPALPKVTGAQKENRNLWGNSSTISCSSKSDAEKSSEIIPKRTEPKHFNFLAPPTFQKDVRAQKENRNYWSNSSTISNDSKSDGEKNTGAVPKRVLLQNLSNSIHSCGSKSDAEKNIEMVPKKALGVKNTGFHSGIKFSGKFQKVTIVEPFTFEKPEARNKPCLLNPRNIPSTRNMKENVPSRTNTDGGGH